MATYLGCFDSGIGFTRLNGRNHCGRKKIAELEKVRSKASVGEVRSEGLPQINGDVGFTNNLAIQTSFIGDFISPVTYSVLLQEGLIEQAPDLDTTPIAAAFGTDYTANAGIRVSQLIFDGAYFIGLKAASTYQEVAQKEEIKTKWIAEFAKPFWGK